MQPVRMERLLAKLEAGKQVTIVALGDSNTALSFHTRGCLSWPYLLQQALWEKYGPNTVIMIDGACYGEGAAAGLKRLERDVLRFSPDLVIVCYWDSDMGALRQVVQRLRAADNTEVLLRTPNPVVAPNMPRVTPPVQAGREWPGSTGKETAQKIVDLARELRLPVVDHYSAWMAADASHHGPPSCNPNKLWMRMSDATHPGPTGHVAFFRDMAPLFELPPKLSWEF
jgi:acyl-CoA thioesterase I